MLEAFLEIVAALERAKIPYCVIGGIAVLLYGGRASTLDLDVYILTRSRQKTLDTLANLGAELSARGEFQLKGRYRGFAIDLLIADRWLGVPALKRAKKLAFAKKTLRVATPEDVIVMKTIADRPVDRRDIAELRELFSKRLDEKYIEKRLTAVRNTLAR